jgi:hypothetical protein
MAVRFATIGRALAIALVLGFAVIGFTVTLVGIGGEWAAEEARRDGAELGRSHGAARCLRRALDGSFSGFTLEEERHLRACLEAARDRNSVCREVPPPTLNPWCGNAGPPFICESILHAVRDECGLPITP